MAHFTRALFSFLRDLAEHNDRDWFQAHKERYESEVLEPCLAFVTDMGPRLADLSPHFLAIPKKQGGSLFRIHRDVRFSKDKSPYKTNVAMHFRHEQASRDVHAPGFYLHLEPGDVGVGAGSWRPDPAALAHIRSRIATDPDGWQAVRGALEEGGLSFMGESLKRPPKGYDKDHPLIEDLKRKDFAVHFKLSEAAVLAEDFLDQVVDGFGRSAPLVRYLCETQSLPY